MSSPYSAKAEYACVAMIELAARYGDSQPVRLKDVAAAHGIPQRFLVQILLQLKANGLVNTTRGAAGGYQLGRAPLKITLADIVGIIDQTDTEPARTGGGASPSVEAVRGVWKQINTAQMRILADTTLADLLDRARNSEALTYQI